MATFRLQVGRVGFLITLITFWTSNVSAAVNSFLSPVGTVGGGATLSSPTVALDLDNGDDTGSLYLWLQNETMLRTAAFDISATTEGVIEFLGAEVFQADVVDAQGVDFGNRWNLPTGNGRVEWGRQKISNFVGVNVTETGLDPARRAWDSLFDPMADAALFARVDFRALSAGTTDLLVSMGDTLIVEAGSSVLPATSFGSASISVTGTSSRDPLGPPSGAKPPWTPDAEELDPTVDLPPIPPVDPPTGKEDQGDSTDDEPSTIDVALETEIRLIDDLEIPIWKHEVSLVERIWLGTNESWIDFSFNKLQDELPIYSKPADIDFTTFAATRLSNNADFTTPSDAFTSYMLGGGEMRLSNAPHVPEPSIMAIILSGLIASAVGRCARLREK